ncbi:30S ribosomal protein S7 [Candidatus Kaiserbacteria bacterium RIFCSPHIGHO2_01_FULL_49_13]|uniref:Small ribosomal subunit protein uS7 n=1 Tax=Candidatus Kaiserbacteria bacterium RIFCSPHIGHO2_01_FULL_49_13 TaxID=1798477 RepID=A0A1F6CDJ5_9BACT|nr:MAG: 30S ribosomal protein S7 [Candidatus Kaiserbacteria bacterium RIFCSPHIGHO2_01_FULL_49_13]
MRRKLKARKELPGDAVYNSVKVAKLVNHIMKKGEKATARKVVYGAMNEIKEKTKGDPLPVFEAALKNVSPAVEVRSRRVGGANYQVPREVRAERRLSLAYRWIIAAANAKKGVPMYKKLADEIIAASNSEGAAFKKKEDTHKMAESNKAFAHFAW